MELKSYVVVWSDHMNGLELEIAEHINSGYVPTGGCILVESQWYQAMVLKSILTDTFIYLPTKEVKLER